MQTVYEASSAVEAHMLRDLLKQEGITAHIQGEHLQGAIGELPAAGLVRVMVEPDDYARARQVVERWDAEQPQHVPSTGRPVRRGRTLVTLLAGVTAGVLLSWGWFRAPATLDGIDHNGDGVLDDRWTYAPEGRAVRNEVDRNLDGRIDLITLFDRRGLPESFQSDDDFDGVFETRGRYVAGNVSDSQTDTDGDGYPDLRQYWHHGVLETAERVDPATGQPLRVDHFRLNQTVSAEIDTDHDGRLDVEQTFTALGELRDTRRLPVAAPAS